MSYVRGEPELVQRQAWTTGGWPTSNEVADFTKGDRPAYRVACHCRNCNWKAEARMRVGEKVSLWLRCPKCENKELRVDGEFLGRDELSLDEEQERFREAAERANEARRKSFERPFA